MSCRSSWTPKVSITQMGHCFHLVLLLLLFSHLRQCHSWAWYHSSTPKTNSETNNKGLPITSSAAKFSMEAMNDNPKAVKLVEEARSKSVRSSSCWQNAYENLSASCSEIIADEEKKRRLAWDLSDCFQKESGRQGFPSCDSRSPMKKCLERLDDAAINNIFLDFLLDTNSICHQLQLR